MYPQNDPKSPVNLSPHQTMLWARPHAPIPVGLIFLLHQNNMVLISAAHAASLSSFILIPYNK